MKKNEKFEDILNGCFERLLAGGTVEECLVNYPEVAKELEPLLKTFSAAKVAARVEPRAEFKAQAKYQFQRALAEMSGKEELQTSRSWHWRWQSAWSIATIAILIVVVAGGSTIAAAGNSMPDGALYSLKLTAERVQLALTPSDLGKAELNARLADKRVEEINYMVDKGDTHEVQILAQRLNTNMQNIVHLAGGDGSSQERALSGTPSGGADSSAKSAGASGSSQGTVGAATPALAPAPSALRPAQAPTTTTPAMTTAAPTTTPAPTTTTAPTATTPATAALPPVTMTVTAPPPALTMEATPAAPSANFGAVQTSQPQFTLPKNASQLSEKGKIALLLVENAGANIEKLNEALNRAAPEVRPAIRQAIAQAQVEYDKALKILQGFENLSP